MSLIIGGLAIAGATWLGGKVIKAVASSPTVSGVVAGAAIGGLAGPVGAIAGGIAGGIMGNKSAKARAAAVAPAPTTATSPSPTVTANAVSAPSEVASPISHKVDDFTMNVTVVQNYIEEATRTRSLILDTIEMFANDMNGLQSSGTLSLEKSSGEFASKIARLRQNCEPLVTALANHANYLGIEIGNVQTMDTKISQDFSNISDLISFE